MIALNVAQIARITGGRLVGVDPEARVTGSVEFDSREVTAGGLFLALPGERVDGHDYVAAAAGRGASAALVTREVPGPCIVVDDGLAALAALASAVLRRLPALSVIGITGSSGKTSTKDLLASLLARLGPTVAPPGSFNNELGHPYTVLRADESTRYLVLENSARGIGHIRELTRIAPPRIGAVLNVGSAHLGEFGSREAIAQAKGELVEALPISAQGGVAVLNADDPLVLAMAARTAARVVTTGTSPDADVRASEVAVDGLGRARFRLHASGETHLVQLGVIGAHQVGNALAAAAVALECGMPPAEVAGALGAARIGSHWRMETTERRDGTLIINDAYNANPESMRAALTALAGIARSRGARSIAVLGPMAELGEATPAEHARLARLAAEFGITRVLAVGEGAREIATTPGGPPSNWVADVDAAVDALHEQMRAGDVVLVKASRSASLERVALRIAEDDIDDESGAGHGEDAGDGAA